MERRVITFFGFLETRQQHTHTRGVKSTSGPIFLRSALRDVWPTRPGQAGSRYRLYFGQFRLGAAGSVGGGGSGASRV